jgi:hypothetical protein
MTKFQIGDRVAIHENHETSDQCFFCAKPISEKQPKKMIALDINQTIISSDKIYSLSYGSDWCFPIGSSCVKNFPSESIYLEQE